MGSYVPVVKNGANGAIFYIGLIDQSNTKLLKSTPTLATGDFKVSIDGGALANLGTLPTVTPAAGRQVKVTLSQAEVNGDNITVQCVDAAGAEWCDLLVNIQTVARQIDDLTFPATSGRSMVVDAAGLVDSNMVKAGPTGAGAAVPAGAIPNAVAGAAGGLQIAGVNAATTYATFTVTGATILTGNVLLSDGLTIAAPSTGNRAGITITGNGTGAAISLTGGATGQGMLIAGGGTSGDGIKVTTTSGHGINLAPVGTSMHGMLITGGNGGASDGVKLVNGTGGVGLRVSDLTVTANAIVSGTTTFTGAVTLSSTLTTGAVTFAGFTTGAISATTITASGTTSLAAVTTSGTVTLNALTVTAATTLTGAVSLGSTLGVTGTATFAAIATGTITTTGNWAVSGTATVTGGIVANITGNLSGSVGSVTGAVGSVGAGGIGSGAHSAAELNNIADAHLDRIMSVGADSGLDDATHRTVRQAHRAIRNKVAIVAGVATVYKEDDATASYTMAVTTTAGNPISALDPT